MEIDNAVAALGALAQETRLRIFRRLVEAGPEGLNAGQIAGQIGVPPSTLSFHLAYLVRVGLVSSRQDGRFFFFSVSFEAMDELLAYLTEDCCRGAGGCLPRSSANSVKGKSRRRAA